MVTKIKKIEELLLDFSFGKKVIPRVLMISLLVKGHVLIEDLPGVGKTTLSRAFSRLLGLDFSRIQGTSDVLPQDVIGGEIIDFKTKEFSLKKGPIFNNIILIDEVNRMHPKSQSAFLQAMEEGQVVINGESMYLPKPFFIIATQNPIEYSGTFPLPEAQRDRFSCQVSIGFPDKKIQKEILLNKNNFDMDLKIKSLNPVFSTEEILEVQKNIPNIEITEELVERIVDFAESTRDKDVFVYGISPRALSAFILALKANAYIEGRDYVIPEDGIDLVVPFFIHRILFLDQGIMEEGKKDYIFDKYKSFFVGL